MRHKAGDIMTTRPHILIINQHGDNRGDEAALRGMLVGLQNELVLKAKFTIVHQIQDISAGQQIARDLDLDVCWIPMRISIYEYAGLVAYYATGSKVLLGKHGLKTVKAFDAADLIISAPGGPYIGDLYSNHEAAHLLYILLGRRSPAPKYLYAPSAGPFNKWWFNTLRRRAIRTFAKIGVREEVSASHLKKLFGEDQCCPPVEVFIDSAMQEQALPASRDSNRRLVAISAINWHYDNRGQIDELRRNYDTSIASWCAELSKYGGTDFILVPQLHGTRHRDYPYLNHLSNVIRTMIGDSSTVKVLDEETAMWDQRKLFAAADFIFAGRYHPAVFGVSAGVPQTCVPYEHKAQGLMDKAGLSDMVIKMEDVSATTLQNHASWLVTNEQRLRERSMAAGAALHDVANEISRTAISLMK